jgi:hypothetical protein
MCTGRVMPPSVMKKTCLGLQRRRRARACCWCARGFGMRVGRVSRCFWLHRGGCVRGSLLFVFGSCDSRNLKDKTRLLLRRQGRGTPCRRKLCTHICARRGLLLLVPERKEVGAEKVRYSRHAQGPAGVGREGEVAAAAQGETAFDTSAGRRVSNLIPKTGGGGSADSQTTFSPLAPPPPPNVPPTRRSRRRRCTMPSRRRRSSAPPSRRYPTSPPRCVTRVCRGGE